MKYIELKIETTHSGVEAVVGKLLAMGITSTAVDDPADVRDIMAKKEAYEWDYIDDEVVQNLDRQPTVTVYLDDTEESQQLAQQIQEAMAELFKAAAKGELGPETDLGTLQVTVQVQDDADWKDKWKAYFKPKQISKTLVVKPTWEALGEFQGRQDLKVIAIDPGMAFGTGTHETTSLCVKMLEKYMEPSDHVLDVGCGSGILSIAAALLGAEDVLGVDIDPVAVEVAEDNLRLNGVQDRTKVQVGDLTEGIDYRADVVVANLMADLVMMLAGSVAKHLRGRGIFISSGILESKASVVQAKLEEDGFSVVEAAADGEWVCLVATRKA